jgi:hypothetical protein
MLFVAQGQPPCNPDVKPGKTTPHSAFHNEHLPELPGVRHQDAVRVRENPGFRIIRQSGHIVMSNGETKLTIPRANP